MPAKLLASEAVPEVSATLMQPCPDLPPASDGTLPVLLQNHTDVALLYAGCKKGKDDLSNAIKAQPGISIK